MSVSIQQPCPPMRARHLSLDRISSLPSSIIETILCSLPIQMAARTSILSREWRYKWTKIPKLEFVEYTFELSTDDNQLSIWEQTYEESNERKSMTKRCKFFYAIFQFLLAHQGPIFEFALSMVANDTCVEINQLIAHLSRNNTLKKLKLNLCSFAMESLSVNLNKLFVMRQLTYLYLSGCDISRQSTFDGFGSLTTLYLGEDLAITKRSLLHHLTNLPLLKSFSLDTFFENIYGDDNFTIFELLERLPLIEHLRISLFVIKSHFGDGAVPRDLPFSLVHLKYLHLDNVCTIHEGFPFFFLMMRCSPNLEKLKLKMNTPYSENCSQFEVDSFTLKDYLDIWLDHLIELEIEDVLDLDPELEFIQLILAKSPVLKKLKIVLYSRVTTNQELQILRVLLRSPRASPLVNIIVDSRYTKKCCGC